ncbi:MAG: hypothetical protein ACJ8CB_33415, partial [Ktedonobacteraceae bacterium]
MEFSVARGDLVFQYPQAGSNLCRGTWERKAALFTILSVPSNRVEPLPRFVVVSCLYERTPFSTLEPGRTSAAYRLPLPVCVDLLLSVPS